MIVFDNRGVDAIAFIKAKGFQQVDLFGFSMGGLISQEIVQKEPALVRKLILAQLQALSAWGQKRPADLSVIRQPVLVANGDDDRMVPTRNSHDLAQRLPNSELVIYADAGHGGVFQYHEDFVPEALAFLSR